MMDEFARFVGYAVMAAGGIMLTLGLFWLVASIAFRMWFSAWNLRDLMDATAEWKRAHPEKFAGWNKRNRAE